MLNSIGKHVSAQFINRPIFIVGGSRSGTIALLKAMGQHKKILSAPTEDPFITDVGRMAMQLDFFFERRETILSSNLTDFRRLHL